MKNKLYIILLAALLVLLSACKPYEQENVEISEGYYNTVTAQGFNGYEASSFNIREENEKVIVIIVWENVKG